MNQQIYLRSEPLERSTWRVIYSKPQKGAWNMALDEAILESVGKNNEMPVLRLYDWEPACLSLGYSQPVADVDLDQLHHFGWDLVRRPTGGRAVLHTDELTYSVIAPDSEPRVKGSVIESYRRLAQALLRALQLLQLNATADHEYDLPSGSEKLAPVCFEVPSNYEITVNGKKLIGSAQARKHHGVLQHGSLPLKGDLSRITRVLRYESAARQSDTAKRLLDHAATTETILGEIIPWQAAANAFKTAFAEVLNIEFIRTEPTEEDIKLANKYFTEKYTNPDWIQHR